MIKLSNIALSLSGNDYLQPYFERQFPQPKLKQGEQPPEPCAGVKVVVTDALSEEDAEFEAYCAENGLPVLTLVCPSVVCTGMQGLPRKIAAGIYRGTFFTIQGVDGRLSVVHGIDVAAAAAEAQGTQGTYVLTDGCDPMVTELAQALSARMGDKRIFGMPQWVAKIWYGAKYYEQLTSDHSMADTFGQAFAGFKPHSVTEYLRTHKYDDNSL